MLGLSRNWNVTGAYDKLLVEGMLLLVRSVKCDVGSRPLKGRAENEWGAGTWLPVCSGAPRVLHHVRKLLFGSQAGTLTKFMTPSALEA